MSNFNGKAKVYSLPGMLVCSSCGSPYMGPMTSDVIGFAKQSSLSNPYPNPAINFTTIDYLLPSGENQGEIVFYDLSGKETRRFKVDDSFTNIKVTTTELAAGTYFFSLICSGKVYGGKKVVVVK